MQHSQRFHIIIIQRHIDTDYLIRAADVQYGLAHIVTAFCQQKSRPCLSGADMEFALPDQDERVLRLASNGSKHAQLK